MNFLGNVLWFVLGGFVIALYYWIVGILTCLTIVGIPFGIQHFKMSILALTPFGKRIS